MEIDYSFSGDLILMIEKMGLFFRDPEGNCLALTHYPAKRAQ